MQASPESDPLARRRRREKKKKETFVCETDLFTSTGRFNPLAVNDSLQFLSKIVKIFINRCVIFYQIVPIR